MDEREWQIMQLIKDSKRHEQSYATLLSIFFIRASLTLNSRSDPIASAYSFGQVANCDSMAWETFSDEILNPRRLKTKFWFN